MINIVQLMLFSDGHLQEREREDDQRSHVKWSKENEIRRTIIVIGRKDNKE